MTNCIIKTCSRCFFLFLFLLPFILFFSIYFRSWLQNISAFFSPPSTCDIFRAARCSMTPPPPSPLTLDDEVDVGGAGPVVGLDAARVRPFVGDLHLVDVDGEVAAVTVGQCDALVQGPLVRPGEQDVGAVKPGLVRHLLVNPTPAAGVVVTGSQSSREQGCLVLTEICCKM